MSQRKSLLLVLAEWWEAREKAATQTAPRLSIRGKWLPTPGTVLFTLVVVIGLLWAQNAGALTLGAPSAGTSTGTIAYQGRLADSAGNPLTETLNMSFRLYSGSSGGAALWTEQWTGPNGVQVSDGLFNVMLGSLTPIAQSLITGNSNLFLGITVGTDDEMTPRVQLGSVPFAVQALTVPDGSITTAKLAADVSLTPPDGSITTAKIVDGAVTQEKLDPSIDLEPAFGFGGIFTANPHTGSCQSPNPFTNSCTCSAGYSVSGVIGSVRHGEAGYQCNGVYCYTYMCYKKSTR